MSEKPSRRHIVLHAALLALFAGAMVFFTIKYGPDITRLMSRPERSREFIASYGAAGPLIYIAIQVVQIVVFVIPGEVVQVAGGYIFGTFLGTLYSVIGAVLGTLIAFMAVRLVGFSLIKTFIPQATLEKFDFLINSPKSEIALFALFLAPGLPKDALTYIAGLTPIKPLRFLVISSLARFPGMLGSAYVGSHLAKKNFWPVIIVGAISLAVFLVGLIYKDRIIAAVRRHQPGRNGGKSDGSS
jgi:uncharacterized membrane protein YdjX (TVP38/TMEM64 family)